MKSVEEVKEKLALTEEKSAEAEAEIPEGNIRIDEDVLRKIIAADFYRGVKTALEWVLDTDLNT